MELALFDESDYPLINQESVLSKAKMLGFLFGAVQMKPIKTTV